jgi:hypothetical protein
MTLTVLQLNDNWDYAPDNDFAREVLAGLDSSDVLPQSNMPSPLCRRCHSLRLWYLTYSFQDSLAGLEDKANEEQCKLCQLLLQCIQGRVKGYSGLVRFSRAGSYLTLDDGRKQPVANLYTMPRMYWDYW